MRNLIYYFPGILLVLLAIAIIAVPQILVAIVAATMIMLGIIALQFGHMLRKSEQECKVFTDRFDDNEFYERRFARIPVINRWWQGMF